MGARGKTASVGKGAPSGFVISILVHAAAFMLAGLLVIKDSRGKVIAYQTPSEKLYRNLNNLREIHVGWYFDKKCNRCLPTPPNPFPKATTNN